MVIIIIVYQINIKILLFCKNANRKKMIRVGPAPDAGDHTRYVRKQDLRNYIV